MINDNYFCWSPRTGLAGSWVMAAACETARFPCGGRVGHECTGSAIARESDVRKDIGGSGGGGRDERADGAHVAARGVAVDGEGPRTWRTREDPFADVWQSEVVPQLVADTDGRLQVLTLFTVLCRRHPGRFQAGQLRTL